MKVIKENVLSIAVALIVFLILSIAYMYPSLEGKNLRQSDIVQFQGMSKELVDYRNQTGKEALWTNSQFSGMPGYLISTKYKSNIFRFFHNYFIFTLFNWRPVCFIFLSLIGFYIALLAFGVNKWLSISGAIAYGFSSYLFTIIAAGHVSKVFALGYMPPIIAGVYLAFRGKYLIGSILMGLFLSLQIFVVHLQITYYTLLIVIVYGLFELIAVIRENRYKQFVTALASLSLVAVLAVFSNLSNFWTTYEYSKYSIRGKSELTANIENQTSGLDKDYITQWSYGISETFTLLIPNFKGGSSNNPLPEKSKTYEFLKKVQGASNAKKTIKHAPTYWGSQPFTSGPFYAGAIAVFLFVFGLFIIKGKVKWWIVTVTILALFLSWGKNFAGFTDFFLDFVPGYDKFRSVSMTLIIAGFAIPLLGILAINKILKKDMDKAVAQKHLLKAFYITAGICFFFLLTAGMWFDFEGEADEGYLAQGAHEFVKAIQADRLMLLRKDAFRSMVYISLAAGLIYLYLKQKIMSNYLILGLGLLILIDMWAIDKRYLNNNDFVTKREYKNPIPKTKADNFILRDKDPDYRVLNLSVSPFMDATTSYYHKSIGGYHGAKMRRYQELADYEIFPEMQRIIGALQQGRISLADSTLRRCNTLNMLNTRYVIYNPEAIPLINDYAYGNAWFVSRILWAENADEEIALLASINNKDQTVVDKRFKDFLTITPYGKDTSAFIGLLSYTPNKLIYNSVSTFPQVAVFSEIYYPKGWNVYIDGEKSSYFRANYILRAMVVPQGKHEIEFRFEPKSYFIGNKIAYASSGLLLLLIIGALALELRKLKPDDN